METYRKVLCSDRLPEKDGWYFTQHGTSRYYVESGFYIAAEYWLEAIPEVTVEEIGKIIREKAVYLEDRDRMGRMFTQKAAQAIHRLYGGETKMKGE